MKLRLAMVTPFPEKHGTITGGVEGVAFSLTSALQKIGDLDLHIVAPCVHNKPGIEERDGMTLHWLTYPKLPRVLTYWNIFRRKIHKCLNQISPDITHFQCTAGFTIGYDKPFLLTIHGINEKDVLYAHGPFLHLRHKLLSKIEKAGRLHTDNIILINPYVHEEIGNQLHGNKWNIENPINVDFFELERKGTEPVILFVGRVAQRKNVHGLIRSFEIIKTRMPSAKLRIAGNPENEAYYGECKNYIHEHNLSEAVHFLGNLDREALLRELSQASCLALISFQETAPLVIEEAMAAGVPVVASRLCGMPHMIDDGKSGYLVDPNNQNEIVEKMLQILGNDKMNREMGERSRSIAQMRFHPLQVAISTLKVYGSILENYRR